MIVRCDFDLHFPDDVEHFFMCLLAHFLICVSSLGKCLFSSSAQFFIGFFHIELYEFFIFWILIIHMVCKYLLPFSR